MTPFTRLDRSRFLSLVSAIAGVHAVLPATLGCNAALGIEGATLADAGSDAAPEVISTSNPDAGADVARVVSPTAAKTCNEDTRTDPKSCGECGHDCRGGACIAGRCQPLVFTSGLTNPEQLVAGKDDLFWFRAASTGGPATSILHCPLLTCYGGPKDQFGVPGPMTESVESMGLAVHGSDMVWTALTQMLQAGPNGGPNVLVDKPNHRFMRPLVKGGSLYWHDFAGASGATPGGASYQTCTMPECKDVRTIHSTPYSDLGEFTVEGDHIYFAFVQTNVPDGFIWGVATCPIGGCSGGPVVLATAGREPKNLKANGSYLVWSASEGNPPLVCNLPNCAGGPTPIAKETFANSMGIDGTHVYFIDGLRQTINRCPLAGCGDAPEVLADAQHLPKNLVLTDNDIYWTTAASTIIRLAK